MSDREALAAALEMLYEPTPDEQGRNTTPVRYPLDVIGAAARERLAQLPRMCDRCAGLGVLGLMESVCFDCDGSGKVYPTELVAAIANVLSENDFDSDCDGTHHIGEAVAVLAALGGEPP